jgi:hypothetical protein
VDAPPTAGAGCEPAFDVAGGVEMPVGGMTGIAELGFSLGLTDIEKDAADKQEDSSTKTRTIFLSLGIRL